MNRQQVKGIGKEDYAKTHTELYNQGRRQSGVQGSDTSLDQYDPRTSCKFDEVLGSRGIWVMTTLNAIDLCSKCTKIHQRASAI